jgi:hypothetical protein
MLSLSNKPELNPLKLEDDITSCLQKNQMPTQNKESPPRTPSIPAPRRQKIRPEYTTQSKSKDHRRRNARKDYPYQQKEGLEDN